MCGKSLKQRFFVNVVEVDAYRPGVPGGGGTHYNGLYGEAPPERGTFRCIEGQGFHKFRYMKG